MDPVPQINADPTHGVFCLIVDSGYKEFVKAW
jgi:hypothetical protein